MADEKKPIELTEDELDNAAGGFQFPGTRRTVKGLDSELQSAHSKLSDNSASALGAAAGTMSGIGAGTKGIGAGTKSGNNAGTMSGLDENK